MVEARDKTIGTRRVQRLIGHLAETRNRTLVTYCRVAGLHPYTSEKPVTALLREFCQRLVDYVAAGHFVLFEQLVKDSPPEVRTVAKAVFEKLEASTSEAIDFNDAYADGADIAELDVLWADLSALGEVLAVRAEAEDALISVLRDQAGCGKF